VAAGNNLKAGHIGQPTVGAAVTPLLRESVNGAPGAASAVGFAPKLGKPTPPTWCRMCEQQRASRCESDRCRMRGFAFGHMPFDFGVMAAGRETRGGWAARRPTASEQVMFALHDRERF
jgi:hypothetical protein